MLCLLECPGLHTRPVLLWHVQAQLTEQQAQLSQQHQEQQNAEKSHIVVSTLALIPISGCMHSVFVPSRENVASSRSLLLGMW